MNLYKVFKLNKVKINYLGYDLKFKLNKLSDTEILKEIFVDEVYSFLDVKDKVVVDIGAFIGDTAIYFLIKGADKVISLEKDFDYQCIANYNINLFIKKYPEFKNKIELLNLGYGLVELKDMVSKYNINHGILGLGCKVNLEKIVSKYNIDSGILKMDCEGCEYNILNEDNDILKKFDMIQIEYHYGYGKLVEKLKECEFNVKYTEPKRVYDVNVKKILEVGEIYAYK